MDQAKLSHVPPSVNGGQHSARQANSTAHVRFLKHNLDMNSPRTQQAFLNLGLTAEDIQQKSKQMVSDKTMSDDANELKYKQYVARVNEAIRRIQYERKEVMRKATTSQLTIDQVFSSTMRPMSTTHSKSTKHPFPTTLQSITPQHADVGDYQMQMLKYQGRQQIQREQNELKQFLIREKQKTKLMRKMEERFKKVEEKKSEKYQEIKELAKLKDDKRAQKSENRRVQEKEFQKSLEQIRKQEDKSRTLDRTSMMSNFRSTANQLAIQGRIDMSRSKRDQLDQETNKKIEEDKQHIIEKQIRSAINHELVLEDKVAILRNKANSIHSKQDFVKTQQSHSELINENKYLNKTEAINKKRTEQERRYQDKAKRLGEIHMIKREKYESHKRELQTQQKSMQSKILGESKDFQTAGMELQNHASQQFMLDRRHLMSEGSMRNFSREQKEMYMIKKAIVEENLVREKRKLQWRKLNILAKEQLRDEKIKSQKEHQRQMLYSQDDLRKRMNIERDKVNTAIVQVKAAPFSPNAKRIVQRTLPSKAGRDIEELYRDSSEERRKKKDEEKNGF